MTRFAGLDCWDVRRTHARGDHAVVTACAGASDLCMINSALYYGYLGCARQMVGFADIGGRHMGRGFATGHHTVVTTDTGADDFAVLHVYRRYPWRRGAVTRIAGVAGLNVGGAFARGGYAIVTRDTRADHLGMIHRQ